MTSRGRATVVGAGIVGLSAAHELLGAGWEVRVLADKELSASTSWVAAAVWFPTLSGPQEKVARWAAHTYRRLAEQAEQGVPGVLMRESLNLYREPPGPQWWADAVGEVRPARPDELPPRYEHGLRYAVPLVEMPIYLPWLLGEVRRRGGVLETRHVASLAEAGDRADLVVHCSGLAARTLVGDQAVVPVRGQIVRVANPGLSLSVRDEHHPAGRAYVHPRTHDCILGGTFEEGRWDTAPDPRTSAAIIERCCDIVPELDGVEVLEHIAGLRPARPTVRLERDGDDPAVIHDYGHGGSGVTLGWGCAAEVVALADG